MRFTYILEMDEEEDRMFRLEVFKQLTSWFMYNLELDEEEGIG